MADTQISKVTASMYRKEIATGKGWVGSGANKQLVTLTPAAIQQRKLKLDQYDAGMAQQGKTRSYKWAKQLQSTTSDIKKDTTKLVATTEQIDERTKAMKKEVGELKQQLADYAEKVQVHTQPAPGMIRIVTEMTGPSVPVKILNAILKSRGWSCPGSKQDKAAFLGEHFDGQEKELRDLILKMKNLVAQGLPLTEAEKKRMEKKKSEAATESTATPQDSCSESDKETGPAPPESITPKSIRLEKEGLSNEASSASTAAPSNSETKSAKGMEDEKTRENASKASTAAPQDSDSEYSYYSESEEETAGKSVSQVPEPVETLNSEEKASQKQGAISDAEEQPSKRRKQEEAVTPLQKHLQAFVCNRYPRVVLEKFGHVEDPDDEKLAQTEEAIFKIAEFLHKHEGRAFLGDRAGVRTEFYRLINYGLGLNWAQPFNLNYDRQDHAVNVCLHDSFDCKIRLIKEDVFQKTIVAVTPNAL